ncbi:MarR family winged helix-turn-helix transcriptional regulator [Streptomyces sp. NBC_00963]|uniref:MarR family winged helix-turn-helix transcriptional regulator n=1 Tax=Streptomyces sp. NBC_00963 TaxID=2903697 RepID=UPI003867F97A|nr:MarR family winged helix-turn-helix transcriptional regulator [Streptomyces sp. NBC_00963]
MIFGPRPQPADTAAQAGEAAGGSAVAPAEPPDPGGVPAAAPCTVHEGLRNLVQLLPRVARALRSRTGRGGVSDTVLGPRHGAALALLREEGTTVGNLAAVLDLNLATVSGLVADLERAGFAERSTDPADRRRTLVRIVPDREAAVDRWLEESAAPITRVLQRLSPQERTVFVKAMGYLEAELNDAGSPSGR